MCKYCNINSDECCIFINPLDGQWYLDIETGQWDDYDDGYVHQREYINYCPYCGGKLGAKDRFKGFPISEHEDLEINEWIKNHDKTCKCKYDVVGAKYSYNFIPTGLGTVGKVICECGEKFYFQQMN